MLISHLRIQEMFHTGEKQLKGLINQSTTQSKR